MFSHYCFAVASLSFQDERRPNSGWLVTHGEGVVFTMFTFSVDVLGLYYETEIILLHV